MHIYTLLKVAANRYIVPYNNYIINVGYLKILNLPSFPHQLFHLIDKKSENCLHYSVFIFIFVPKYIHFYLFY